MPMSDDFTQRLAPIIDRIADHFGTPFYIYDETGIRDTAKALTTAFSGVPSFQEFFAVKALPNPSILKIFKDLGFGTDCSSIPELLLSRQVGFSGEQIMFTSNNTSPEEFDVAFANGGSIINLDDISLVEKLPAIPELVCFRYNPGERRTGNQIIGNPVEAKYGVSHDQIIDAYRRVRDGGATRFGLHTMLASNERQYGYMVDTTKMLLDLIHQIGDAVGITFEFINIGGGLGIPYRPEDAPLDLAAMGIEISALLSSFQDAHGYVPQLCMESGRYMTGPHGALVTRAINRKETYRTYVGVDACMSALMRPGMYGAYHHMTIHGKYDAPPVPPVDVVGSLCENNDKFAVQRALPAIDSGDLILIHDTGAHGHAMGFNYNGKLRPQELLLGPDGRVERIRRAETIDDHFATLQVDPAVKTFT